MFYTGSLQAGHRLGNICIKGAIIGMETLGNHAELIAKTYGIYSKFGSDAFSESHRFQVEKDGSFDYSIASTEETCYVEFILYDSTGSQITALYGEFFFKPFLAETEDDLYIKIDLNKHRVILKGRGHEKWQCQYKMNQIALQSKKPLTSRFVELAGSGHYDQAFLLNAQGGSLITSLQLEILKSFAQQLSPRIYGQLYYDCIGFRNFEMLNYLHLVFGAKKEQVLAAKRFFKLFADTFSTPASIPMEAINSAYYASSLYALERVTLEFGDTPDFPSKEIFTVVEMYNRIKKRYTGNIRDRVLFEFFVANIKYKGDQLDLLRDDAEKLIENEGIQKKIKLLFDNRAKGNPAFDFKLPDTLGIYHALRDYRGKILVIDFWYNGCYGCIQLAKQMHPIIQEFSQNNDVKFLAISIDKTRKSWLSGIRQGLYTSPGQINLYTEGLGHEHPMIRHYNFTTYPQLIIVDRKGNIISTSPPDPRKDEGKLFRKLIYDHL